MMRTTAHNKTHRIKANQSSPSSYLINLQTFSLFYVVDTAFLAKSTEIARMILIVFCILYR
jgi:hypothetical protein